MATKSLPETSKEIVEVAIEKLIPFPKNPRTWDNIDEQQLIESITTFGVLDPLIVNKAKGRENILLPESDSCTPHCADPCSVFCLEIG